MGIRASKLRFTNHVFLLKNHNLKFNVTRYSSGRVSPSFIQCLYAVFGYKRFLTTINYLYSYVLFMAAIYYFRRLYTTYGGYILLSVAAYYFRRIYVTFDGYMLLLALPDCDFVRIQYFITISRTYGLQARLDFNINLLALIQFFFFCSSMLPFKNSVLLEIIKCWNCEILFALRYDWFARQLSKPTICIN